VTGKPVDVPSFWTSLFILVVNRKTGNEVCVSLIIANSQSITSFETTGELT
jgi:hypothetical protein